MWVQMAAPARRAATQLETYPVVTPHGPVPLAELGRFDRRPPSSPGRAWSGRSTSRATALIIGAVWSMIALGKHSCTPAFMGLILLAGIVVKNSILLIDFIAAARSRGEDVNQALIGAVRVRTRPILMTAVGTAVGMIPVAGEWAIGLERLSPLAVVAIGGLLVSTFLTMVYVPVLYSLFDDAQTAVTRVFRGRATVTSPSAV